MPRRARATFAGMNPRGPRRPPALATSSKTSRAGERLRVDEVEGATRRPRVLSDGARGARDVVDRDERERGVAAAREREGEVGRRGEDEHDEEVRAVEAIDLARRRVADDDGRTEDARSASASSRARSIRSPRARVSSTTLRKRLPLLELVLVHDAARSPETSAVEWTTRHLSPCTPRRTPGSRARRRRSRARPSCRSTPR